MKLLVTGREGQLARSLAEQRERHPGLELIFAERPKIDLEQPGNVAEAIEQHRPDVVINAAAFTAVDQAEDEPERAMRINAHAAGEAAEAAEKMGAAFIQISTDYVFPGTSERPYVEDDETGPIGVYGRSKLLGEELVRAACDRHVIIRTAWVYSPFGRNFVKSMVAAAAARDRLTVVDDQRGNPTSALDLANAIFSMVERWTTGGSTGLGRTYHVAGQGVTSWCGLAAQVMTECRSNGLPTAKVVPIRTEEWATRAARPTFSALDCSRFANEIGASLPRWKVSVGETVRRLAEDVARA